VHFAFKNAFDERAFVGSKGIVIEAESFELIAIFGI